MKFIFFAVFSLIIPFQSFALTFPSLEDFFVSKEEAVIIRRQIKEDPVSLSKVQERLQLVAQQVVRENPDLVDLAQVIHQDGSWYFQKIFLLKLFLQSPFFQHLKFEILAKEQRSFLLIYNVDTVTMKGSAGINGFQFLKAIVSKDMRRQQLDRDAYIKKELEPCLKRKFSFINAFDLNSCILRYHALINDDFSTFLVSVYSDLKRLEYAIKKEMNEGKFPASYLSNYKYNICNKESWGWCTESLKMNITVEGKAAGVVFGDLKLNFNVDAKSLDFDIAITTRRELIDFAISQFGDKVTNLDIIKYLLLKKIERLNDEQALELSRQVSTMVRDTAEWVRENTVAPVDRRNWRQEHWLF